jgi:hypothetical protein
MEQIKNNFFAAVRHPPSPAPVVSEPAPAARTSDQLTDTLVDHPPTRHRAQRSDGWTPDRIRIFLDTLSQCGVVSDAARDAGVRVQSAYAIRNSARGRAFDVAWRAALLLARRRIADEVMSRAINGCVEVIMRDGEVWGERHRYDNRLTMAVLTRLDALAEGGRQLEDTPRRLAHEFEGLVEAACKGADEAAEFIQSCSALRYHDFDELEILCRNQDYAEARDRGEGEKSDEWQPSTSST